jgi:hypothetical protein
MPPTAKHPAQSAESSQWLLFPELFPGHIHRRRMICPPLRQRMFRVEAQKQIQPRHMSILGSQQCIFCPREYTRDNNENSNIRKQDAQLRRVTILPPRRRTLPTKSYAHPEIATGMFHSRPYRDRHIELCHPVEISKYSAILHVYRISIIEVVPGLRTAHFHIII